MRGIEVAQSLCYSCRQEWFLSSPKPTDQHLGSRILFGGYRLSFPGVNLLWREVDYSSQSSADVNTGTPTFVPTYKHQCDHFDCSYDLPRF